MGGRHQAPFIYVVWQPCGNNPPCCVTCSVVSAIKGLDAAAAVDAAAAAAAAPAAAAPDDDNIVLLVMLLLDG